MLIRRPTRRQNFVMVVYRGSGDAKVDADGRRYGETGGTPREQYKADRAYWFVSAARWRYLVAIVYVVDGVVTRVRAVGTRYGRWRRHPLGAAIVPVGRSLSSREVAQQFAHIGLHLGSTLPAVRGKIREYALV